MEAFLFRRGGQVFDFCPCRIEVHQDFLLIHVDVDLSDAGNVPQRLADHRRAGFAVDLLRVQGRRLQFLRQCNRRQAEQQDEEREAPQWRLSTLKPAFVTASDSRPTSVSLGSKKTEAARFGNETLDDFTPGSRERMDWMVLAQPSHCIPPIFISSDFIDNTPFARRFLAGGRVCGRSTSAESSASRMLQFTRAPRPGQTAIRLSNAALIRSRSATRRFTSATLAAARARTAAQLV